MPNASSTVMISWCGAMHCGEAIIGMFVRPVYVHLVCVYGTFVNVCKLACVYVWISMQGKRTFVCNDKCVPTCILYIVCKCIMRGPELE